jgi:hypothetical protein
MNDALPKLACILARTMEQLEAAALFAFGGLTVHERAAVEARIQTPLPPAATHATSEMHPTTSADVFLAAAHVVKYSAALKGMLLAANSQPGFAYMDVQDAVATAQSFHRGVAVDIMRLLTNTQMVRGLKHLCSPPLCVCVCVCVCAIRHCVQRKFVEKVAAKRGATTDSDAAKDGDAASRISVAPRDDALHTGMAAVVTPAVHVDVHITPDEGGPVPPEHGEGTIAAGDPRGMSPKRPRIATGDDSILTPALNRSASAASDVTDEELEQLAFMAQFERESPYALASGTRTTGE